jgi:TIR domain
MSKIFISYRRDDSAAYAGRLYDRLVAHFGPGQVFMDIDQIEPGEDFVEVINKRVGSCSATIVLIGKSWLSAADAEGNRRLDDPEDFVRQEITTALGRKIRVFPVLVGGAVMPKMAQLPEALGALSRRNGIEITDLRFHHDVDRLIEALAKVLEPQRSTLVGSVDAVSKTTAKESVAPPVSATVKPETKAEYIGELSPTATERDANSEFPSPNQIKNIFSGSRNKQFIAGAIVVVVLLVAVVVRYQSQDPTAAPSSESQISNVKPSDVAPTAVENIVQQAYEPNPSKSPNLFRPTETPLDKAMKAPVENTTKMRTASMQTASLSSGTADELYETGIMYELGGISGERDLDQAAKFYSAAAAKGHKDARLALEDVKAEIAEASRPANNTPSFDEIKKSNERLSRQQARAKIVLDKMDQAAKEAIKHIKGG